MSKAKQNRCLTWLESIGTMNKSDNAVSTVGKLVADDEEFLENGGSRKNDKSNSKIKKRRRLRDKTAPRPPHSGYIRFLNDRREQFRADNPSLPFAEITKLLAIEWNQLPLDKKQQYLLAAEQEREKYVKELAAYKKTDAYSNFIQRKLKRKKLNPPEEAKEAQELEKEKPSNSNNSAVFDIPIFSEEFFNFNKARETELRYLRKTVTDQIQEVSVLNKHIENVNNGICKLTTQNQQLKTETSILEDHLCKIQRYILSVIETANLSDVIMKPSIGSIDKYPIILCERLVAEPSLNAMWKKAMSKVDFSLA